MQQYPLQRPETVGLNILYPGIKYTEKDWVQLRIQQYPLQRPETVGLNILYSGIKYTEKGLDAA